MRKQRATAACSGVLCAKAAFSPPPDPTPSSTTSRGSREDHANAWIIAERLADCAGVELNLAASRTNIIVFRLTHPAASARKVVEACRQQGVLLLAFTESMIRAVTHLDVDAAACRTAAQVIAQAVSSQT